ncbi:MAG: proline dehydrogenase family protein [Candidatus Promineifilaceae bacterium]
MSAFNRLIDTVLFWGGFAGSAYLTYRKMPGVLKESVAALSNNPQAQKLLADSSLSKKLAKRFHTSATVDEAITQVRRLNQQQVGVTLNLMGENIDYAYQALEAKEAYVALIQTISAETLNAHLSIKPSHIGLNQSAQFAQDNLSTILKAAQAANIDVLLETETHDQVEADIMLYNAMRDAGFEALGITLQMVLRRTSHDLESLIYRGAHVRLVQGDNSAGSGAQLISEHDLLNRFTHSIKRLLSEHGARHGARLTLHTASNLLIQTAFDQLRAENLPKSAVDIELRHGERPELLPHLVEEGYAVSVYHPIGRNADAYLLHSVLADPTLLLS